MGTPRNDDDAIALCMRIGLVIFAAAALLRLVLPGSVSAPTWAPWLLGGLLGGWGRKPKLRTRLVALGVVAGLWVVAMTAIVALGPLRAQEGNLAAVAGVQVFGGLLGAAAAFVGLLLSSGWPGTPSTPDAVGERQVKVRIERGKAVDEGVVGHVLDVGAEVEPQWVGRRVMMLADYDRDEVIVAVDELIAMDEPRDS